MPECSLIIDNREGKVHSHTNELSQIKWKREQLTTADMICVSEGHIMWAVERKTLEDQAASLKDGRANNKAKLIELRRRTGCRLFYIVEGPRSPSPNTKFARIPYSAIKASFDHLMLRDGIMMEYTANSVETANALVRMVRSTETLLKQIGDSTFLQQQAVGGESGEAPVDEETANTEFDLSYLTTPIRKSDQDIVREMWACFGGITVETADSFIKRWSIADIVLRRVPRADIEAHKLPNRRSVSKKVVNSLLTSGPVIETKLLSKITLVSAKTAGAILKDRTLNIVLGTAEDVIASYSTAGKTGTKVGKVRAGNILRLFNYKDGGSTLSEVNTDEGHVIGTACDDLDVDSSINDDDLPVDEDTPELTTPVKTLVTPAKKPAASARRPATTAKKPPAAKKPVVVQRAAKPAPRKQVAAK